MMNKNLIIYDKSGGYTGFLGNCMFQWASTIGISVKNEMDYSFPYKEYFDYFEFPFDTFSPKEIGFLKTKDYQEKNFHFDEVILEKGFDYNLTGYFQSYKYFEHCEDLIRKLFTFKQPIRSKCDEVMKQIRKSNPKKQIVSIHFRYGDYLALKEFHCCLTDTDYYKDAKDAIDGIFLREFDKRHLFLVFSNDKKKACEYMDGLEANYLCIENLSVPEDMYLQSLCDSNIIANSSFSWFGAYLNKNKNKIVIAPDENKWFGIKHKEGGYSSKDIVPENWVRL